MKKRTFLISSIIAVTAAVLSLPLFSYDSYEDYRPQVDRKASADSDKAVHSSDSSIELRQYIRGEVFRTSGRIDEDALNDIVQKAIDKEIKRVAQEEAEKAAKYAYRSYPFNGILEIGGFFGGVIQSKNLSTGKSSQLINFAGVANYFLTNNIALSLKGDGSFDISQNTQLYALEIGPMFAFPIDSAKIVSVYATLYCGFTVNSYLNDKYGIRYANELGFKFALSRGVNVNLGIMFAFDNNKFKASGFETVITPIIGITAWL